MGSGTGGGGGGTPGSYSTGPMGIAINVICYIGIYRDGTLLTQFPIDQGQSPIFFSEIPPAGTHTYECRFMNSTVSGKVTKVLLQAMEFKR